jgi:hypothetical protein
MDDQNSHHIIVFKSIHSECGCARQNHAIQFVKLNHNNAALWILHFNLEETQQLCKPGPQDGNSNLVNHHLYNSHIACIRVIHNPTQQAEAQKTIRNPLKQRNSTTTIKPHEEWSITFKASFP